MDQTEDRPGPAADAGAEPPPTPAGPPPLPPAAGRPVRAEFELTYDEYREAAFLRPMSAWTAAAHAAASVVFTGLVWVVSTFLSLIDPTVRPTADEPIYTVAWRMLVGLAPYLVGVPVVLLPVFRHAAGRNRLPWDPAFDPKRPGGWRLAKKVAMTLAFMVAFQCWLEFGGATGVERATAMTAALFALLLVNLANLLIRTAGARSRFDRDTYLHGPTTVEASADGLAIATPGSRTDLRWGAVAGYRETDGTLTVFASPTHGWVVPKRAFATPTELGRFKARLHDHVGRGFLRPTPGTPFAVLPHAAPVA